jgi:peptidoglycan hydrolase-like protein with peptidoglycan-binding domain
MDTLAYTQLVLAWENPSQLTLQLHLQFPKLSNQAFLTFVPLIFAACWLGGTQPSWALLQPGDTGDEVVQLQDRLAERGYFNARSTGYYGEITATAVRQFQADNSLPVDGIVGTSTEAALNLTTSNTPPTQTASDILRQGSQGEAVRNLQNRLRELGYFNAPATGYYGEITATAVRQFQADSGLSVDGIFGARTRRALFGGSSSLTPAASSPRRTTIPLRQGARGEAVVRLQNQLQQLGYFDGPATGYYGRLTADAVQRLQTDRGMTPDGMVGQQTQMVLQQNAPTPSVAMDTNLLQRGSTGEAVAQLQDQLRQLGYLQAESTGFYGPLTETAVESFQRDRNLNPDGVVGNNTQAALNRALSGSVAASFGSGARLLQRGSTGAAVTQLQEQLRQLGYFQANATGFYGTLTETAVRRFQSARNLRVDGVAGPNTQAVLFQTLASAATPTRG